MNAAWQRGYYRPMFGLSDPVAAHVRAAEALARAARLDVIEVAIQPTPCPGPALRACFTAPAQPALQPPVGATVALRKTGS